MFDQFFRGFGFQVAKAVMPLIAVLLVLFVFLTLSVMWDVFAKWGFADAPGETGRTVTLSSEGRAIAVPDTARFTVSIVTRGASPQDIEQRGNEIANRVTAYVKEQGVKDEDIKTVGYNLFPQYDFSNGVQRITGYQLEQSIQIKTTELPKAGSLLSGSIERGANQVAGVEFYVDDPEIYRKQAREEALNKLKQKKEDLEDQADIDFGDVVSYDESFGGGGGIPIPFAERDATIGMGGAVAPDLEPGSQEIILTVVITYELD